jgi:hypothetical protein
MNQDAKPIYPLTLQLDKETIAGLRQMALDRGLAVKNGPKGTTGRGNIQQLLRALVVDYHRERGA